MAKAHSTDYERRSRSRPTGKSLWDAALIRPAKADGSITVAFMDPEAVLKLVDKPGVDALATEVRALLQKVCASLKA